jgi:hypothetical protein
MHDALMLRGSRGRVPADRDPTSVIEALARRAGLGSGGEEQR